MRVILASAVVGAAAAVSLVFGVASVASDNSLPDDRPIANEDALLGSAEYGSRQ